MGQGDDWNINVGFNTQELANATGGGAGGGTGGSANNKGVETVAKGVKGGLLASGFSKMLGLIGAMVGPIAFLAGILGAFVVLFVQWGIPFFRDAERFMLRIAIFTANAIITAIEALTNVIIAGFNIFLPSALEVDSVELPRFREEIILEAFDAFKEAERNGVATAEQIEQAQDAYHDSILDALLTTAEFANVKQLSEDAQISMIQAASSFDDLGDAAFTAGSAMKDAMKKAQSDFIAGLTGEDRQPKTSSLTADQLEERRQRFNEQTNQLFTKKPLTKGEEVFAGFFQSG